MGVAWLRGIFVTDPLAHVNKRIDTPDWWHYGKVHPLRVVTRERGVRAMDRELRDGVRQMRESRA